MVAKLAKILPRCLSMHRKRLTRSSLTAFVLLLLVTASTNSQNFINTSTGKYSGQGTFRVKNNATGLPDTVTGTFEFFGTGKHSIESKNYENLRLKGDANTIRTTTAGDLGILKTVAIADGVRFEVASTMNLEKLEGRITKEEGLIIGKVKKSADFNASAPDSSDFGGIGMSIRSDATSPGTIEILRTSGSGITGSTGNNSISRVYDVNPEVTGGFEGKIFFRYAKDELNNQDSMTLDLWRSIDGNTWRRQRTLRNGNILERTGKFLNGLWTASDASNLLGRKNYEFDPDSIFALGADSLKGRVNKLMINPFVAQVTDIYGNPIQGAMVQFSIDSIPDGAVGQLLTNSNVITNSQGQAETYLHLGDKKGKYKILAKVMSGDSARMEFFGFGESGVSNFVSKSTIVFDTVRKEIGPFTVEAFDDQGLLVSSSEVIWSVRPPIDKYSTMHEVVVSKSDTITNANGSAQAYVLLGEKTGDYIIEARSKENDSVFAAFTVRALHGLPSLANWEDNIARQDTIGAVMPEFKYRITDVDTNAVPARLVRFALYQPDGSLIDTIRTSTNTEGIAKASFNYGLKAGKYIVQAEDINLLGSTRFDTCIAKHGKTAKFDQIYSSVSDTIGATILFGVKLADRGDNPVDSESVIYKFVDVPLGSSPSLIKDSVLTDTSGNALNYLVLGDKIGAYTIQAEASSLAYYPIQFNFNARAGLPQKMLAERGFNQEAEILQPLNIPFEVRLTDRANNPLANDTIRFTFAEVPDSIANTGYSLTNSQDITDINGIASTYLTLGNKIGEYKVRAISNKLNTPVEFIARALPGSARIIAYRYGGYGQKTILSLLDTALTVRVTDLGGNPVSNTLVRFTIQNTPTNAWGYRIGRDTTWSISFDTVRTNSSGLAASYLRLGSKVGAYRVIATSPALSDTIRFSNITATVGAPKILTYLPDSLGNPGNAQVMQIGDTLRPFIVQVRDTGDNFVPYVKVNFTILQRPALDTSAALIASRDTTDIIGSAYTILALGDRRGIYRVKASVPGLKDTVFIAEARMLLADANHDNYQNIGDLTAMIDHVLGKKRLNRIQFLKSDIYPTLPDGSIGDGIVDFRDIVACRDSLLVAGWIPTQDQIQSNLSISFKLSGASVAQGVGAQLLTSTTDSCYIQTTHIGSRFTLKNSIPIKGMQAVIYLKNPAIIDTTDLIFPRASMMRTEVKSVGKVVTVILWNTNNIPIEPGDSAIFRLPVQLTNNNVDSINILMSTGDNNTVGLLGTKNMDIRNLIPKDYMLYQNYPNPFNPSTTIQFDVPEVAGRIPRVAIQIFNILGQKVTTIERNVYDAGRYTVTWHGVNENGARVASGVYFYRLLAGEYASTKKMVMLK